MAQISQILYNDIIDAYAAINVSLSTVETNARVALDAIVDVDTLDYPNASTADADAALEIELALLTTFNSAYVGSASIASSTASLLDAVSAVNDFVITNYYPTGGTATANLTSWINVSMLGFYTATNCPEGWANMSSDAGYDTSAWDLE